jgi:glycosyltransferase involved in cell wall biosynthesis
MRAYMRTALEIVFWLAAALVLWTQLGYALVLAALARVLPTRDASANAPSSAERSRAEPSSAERSGVEPSGAESSGGERSRGEPFGVEPRRSIGATLPGVSLIVAAHDEQESIAAKVGNALALDYPRELLEVIVACDGCGDATAERARAAGADLVLELARGGKIRAQDAAVERARGEIVAFSDANSMWAPDALRVLVGAFAREEVGYACGRVRFVQAAEGARATNQEGLYWRYEMAVRALESRLCSITAGNGAIYATRRETYLVVDPIMGHDLSFPFQMVKRGWRAVYVPGARASEPMVPSIEGELARKRRMMSHTWPIVLRGGMLSPRGYPPRYALMILSHRLLRYATPFLHALALAANIALLASGHEGRLSWGVYWVTLVAQIALLAAAGLGGVVRVRPLLVARYYVLTTASLALGLWDWLRHGTSASWEAAEGTRPAGPAQRSTAEGAR